MPKLADKIGKVGVNMALDDLDLEFDDEEESKKKKSDVVLQNVDIEFHMQEDIRPEISRPEIVPQPTHSPRPQAVHSTAQVKKIDEVRSAPIPKRPNPQPQSVHQPAMDPTHGRTVGGAALKNHYQPHVAESHQTNIDTEDLAQLRDRARRAELEAEVKIQVAEFKTEFLSELLSDMKLMDHQVNQYLSRINAKYPDLKQEVLMIKKILADYTTKKRK